MMRRSCRLKVAATVAALGLGIVFAAANVQAGWFRDRGRCCSVYTWVPVTSSAAPPTNRGITAPVPPASVSQGFLPPAPPLPPGSEETAPAPAPHAGH
jgi:hypothetical protein